MVKRKWTLEKIKEGFDRFHDQNGRYPSVQEIDKLSYLPSCRQIQRNYGGLPKLRALLGHEDIFLSKGKHRSRIGYESNKRSRESETKLKSILFKQFHEPFVHIEKPIDVTRKLRADFYVYNPIGNFAVDIFTTETFHDMSSNVYIKLQKYSHIGEKMYLVLLSKNLTREDVHMLIERKKTKFPKNIELITFSDFIGYISNIPAYKNPVNNHHAVSKKGD